MVTRALNRVTATSISIATARMKSHLLLVVLALLVVSDAEDQLLTLHQNHFGDIQTCDVKYVKPGDDYDIRCESDHAILTRVSYCLSLIILFTVEFPFTTPYF